MVSAIAVTYKSGPYITSDVSGTPTWVAGNVTGLTTTTLNQSAICKDRTIYVTTLDVDGTTVLSVCKQVDNANWTVLLDIDAVKALIGAVAYADPVIVWVDADEDNSNYVAVIVSQRESLTITSVYMLYSTDGGANWLVSTIVDSLDNNTQVGKVEIGNGRAFASYRKSKSRFMSNSFPPSGSWAIDVSPDNTSTYLATCILFDEILYWQRAYNELIQPAIFYKDLASGVTSLASTGTTVEQYHYPAIARLSSVDIIVISGVVYSSNDNFTTLTPVSTPDETVDLVFKYPYTDELVFACLKDKYNDSCLWYSNDDGVTLSDKTGNIPAAADGITIGGLRLFAGQLYVRNVAFSDETEITGEPLPNSQGAYDVHTYEALHASDLTSADTTEHHLPTSTTAGALPVAQGGGYWKEKVMSGDGTLSAAGALHVTQADHATNSDQFGGIPLASFGFLDLNDTPATYEAGKYPKVNPGGTGLIWDDGTGSGSGVGSVLVRVGHWVADGPVAVANEVGGVFRVPYDILITEISCYLKATGATGATLVDFEYSPDGGVTWITLFTTQGNRPSIAAGATDRRATATPDITELHSGDLIRMNIEEIARGAVGVSMPRCLSAQIDAEVYMAAKTLMIPLIMSGNDALYENGSTYVEAAINGTSDYISRVRFDASKIPATATVKLQARIKSANAGGTVSARLYNVTGAAAITGAEVTRTAATLDLVESSDFRANLPAASATFCIQYKGDGTYSGFIEAAWLVAEWA